MHSKRIQEKVKNDYDQIADAFSESRQSLWKEFDVFLKYYQADSNVLDLGCGNGRLLGFLEKHGFKNYLGIDQSEKLLAHARIKHPHQKFILADISMLPDLDLKFDFVFAIASFHHLPAKDQLRALQSWRATMQPGAKLFMTNWNLFQGRFWRSWLKQVPWPTYGLLMLEIPWKKEVNRLYFAFTEWRLKRLLKKAGFKVLHQEKGQNILTIAQA